MSALRPVLLVLASAVLSAMLPPPAAARDGWMFSQERGRSDRQQVPPRRNDLRDEREDQGRRSPAYPQRLSPDERRQLRRDLHDANRDLRPRRDDFRR